MIMYLLHVLMVTPARVRKFYLINISAVELVEKYAKSRKVNRSSHLIKIKMK